MGVDIHMYMGYKGKEVILFKKKEGRFGEIPIYDGRNYDLFEYIQEHCFSLDENLPIPDPIKKTYIVEKEWCYGFREITLADMALHIILHEEDERTDDEREGFEAFKNLFEQAKTYFNLWNDGDYEPSFSNVKLYMWFDN